MTVEAIESWTTRLVSRPLAWLIFGGWLAAAWMVRCVRSAAARIARGRSAQAVS